MSRSLVVGSGSIGSRHASVLRGLGHDVAVVSRRPGAEYGDLATAIAEHRPDYVVVAVETSAHHETVTGLAELGFEGAVLVEKPLAVPPMQLNAAPFRRIGVAYNLRFHPVIEALRAALADASILTVEAHAGQHLSEWRPGRSIAAQYSSTSSLGGGVLRDLSHELDYLALLFGTCEGVFARGGRIADITIDSDDAWGLVAEYQRAPILTLQLNYLDRPARRRLLINTIDSTFDADLVERTLTIDGETTTFGIEQDDTYRRMHLAMLDDTDSSVTSVAEAVAIDRLIELIERSSATREWMTPS